MTKTSFLTIVTLAAGALLSLASAAPPATEPTAADRPGLNALTFHVSPDGDDANAGTQDKPFRSVRRAQEAVRKLANIEGNVHILLRGGTHVLDRPIVFEPADSGRGTGRRIIYWGQGDAARPTVLSGGRQVTGWAKHKDNIWKAASPVDDFRQLYVNGKRAVRARGAVPAGLELVGNEGYRTSEPSLVELVHPPTREKTPQPPVAKWRNIEDVEFCYLVVWTHSRCKWAAVRADEKDKTKAFIAMQQPTFEQARTKEGVQVAMPAYVENAMELMDEPGEFYLDRPARTMYYIPREGEDLAKAEVVVPALQTLAEFRGERSDPVENITFHNVTFADGTWLQPSKIGHADVQANFLNDPAKALKRDGKLTTIHNEQIKSPANVVCRHARGILFFGCTFTRLGGAGLDIERGSTQCAASGCRFFDIAGSAIQIGDVGKDDHHPDDPALVVARNAVTDCLIRDCCLDYKGGVGIFVGYTAGTVLANNEIRDLPYSGISVGWGWGEEDAGGGAYAVQGPAYKTPTPCRANLIENNHIHHVMKELHDGGGIYTLGNQPGTIIRGNHLHDNRGGPGGIYLDEGSGFIEITGNAVYKVPTPMNYNNRAQDRIKTCKEHDNFFKVEPPPKDVVDKAGPRKIGIGAALRGS